MLGSRRLNLFGLPGNLRVGSMMYLHSMVPKGWLIETLFTARAECETVNALVASVRVEGGYEEDEGESGESDVGVIAEDNSERVAGNSSS